MGGGSNDMIGHAFVPAQQAFAAPAHTRQKDVFERYLLHSNFANLNPRRLRNEASALGVLYPYAIRNLK